MSRGKRITALNPQRPFYSYEEASDYLHLPLSALEQLADCGFFPSIDIEGQPGRFISHAVLTQLRAAQN